MERVTKWVELDKLRQYDEDDIGRRIVFSNVIFISLAVVYTIFIIIDFGSYLKPVRNLNFDEFIVPGVVLMCLFCLFLNKVHLTWLSRILFLIVWPFLLHIIPIVVQNTPADYYVVFPFGIIFHAFMIQLMISYRRETILFVILMVINFSTLVMAGTILNENALPDSPLLFLGTHPYFRIDSILYWLLFNLTLFFVIYVIELYIKRVNRANQMIEEQNKEITEQKEKINQINKSLEQRVTERTLQLKEQNKKLKDYAFYNAHLLRAPFSSIKGLVVLEELAESKNEPKETQDEIRDKLKRSIDDLEGIIKNIQDIVE